MTTTEINTYLSPDADHSIRTDEAVELTQVKVPLGMTDLYGNTVKLAGHRFPGVVSSKIDMVPEQIDSDPTPVGDQRPKVVGDLDAEDFDGNIDKEVNKARKSVDSYGQDFEQAVMTYEVADRPGSRILARLFDKIAPIKTFRRSTRHETNASVLAGKVRNQERVARKLKPIPSQREY